MTWWQGALALYLLGAAVSWLVLLARLARNVGRGPDAVSWDALRLATVWPLTWAVVGAILLGETIVFRMRRRSAPGDGGEGES